MESIPGLLKRLKIQAQATLDSVIVSLESILGLLKRLQIRAQATLASGIGSLESIPWLHNMKIEDEGDFFGIKMNIFVPQLSKGQRITNLLFLNYRRNKDKPKYLFLNYPGNEGPPPPQGTKHVTDFVSLHFCLQEILAAPECVCLQEPMVNLYMCFCAAPLGCLSPRACGAPVYLIL